MEEDTPSTSQAHEMKEESEPIFSLYNINNASLEELNNTHETIGDDDSDCEMIGEIVPSPLPSTSEGLIKRDSDPISSDTPFITSVINLHLFSV